LETCNQHSGFEERIKTLERLTDRLSKRISKVELVLAKFQGKWVVIAVFGMAAVSAVFKYLLPTP
jgi:hypothetical protein